MDADCSWGADEAGPRRFKAKPPTQTPSALRVHSLTLVNTSCGMFQLEASPSQANGTTTQKEIAASVQEARSDENPRGLLCYWGTG